MVDTGTIFWGVGMFTAIVMSLASLDITSTAIQRVDAVLPPPEAVPAPAPDETPAPAPGEPPPLAPEN